MMGQNQIPKHSVEQQFAGIASVSMLSRRHLFLWALLLAGCARGPSASSSETPAPIPTATPNAALDQLIDG
jgi:hypothetical protein